MKINKLDVLSDTVEILEAVTSEHIHVSYHSGAWHLESFGEVICKHEDFLEFIVLCEEYSGLNKPKPVWADYPHIGKLVEDLKNSLGLHAFVKEYSEAGKLDAETVTLQLTKLSQALQEHTPKCVLVQAEADIANFSEAEYITATNVNHYNSLLTNIETKKFIGELMQCIVTIPTINAINTALNDVAINLNK